MLPYPDLPEEEDATLVKIARTQGIQLPGNRLSPLDAFSLLVQRYQGAVRAFLAVRLGDSGEAEDLAQEVFLTAHRKLTDCDISRPFLPWLKGIAHNLLRNHLRKFRAIPLGGNEDLQMILDQRLASEWQRENEELRLTALKDCMEGVDAPCRELLQARYAEGLSVAELSNRFGAKHSALTMQLHRLRANLAACIEGKLATSSRAELA